MSKDEVEQLFEEGQHPQAPALRLSRQALSRQLEQLLGFSAGAFGWCAVTTRIEFTKD